MGDKTLLSNKGLIKPKKLKKGDKVAAISLSFGAPALFPKRFQTGCSQFTEAFGVDVVPTKNALRDPEFLSANPQARADDIIEALEDSSISGIICNIGGEDSIRVNPLVDPYIIKEHPKIFLGYSDATTTHLWFLKAGVVSFYGPTIMAGFAENGGLPTYLSNSIERNLFQTDSIGIIMPNTEGWTTEFLDWREPKNQSIKRKLNPSSGPMVLQGHGIIKGHLIGGCVEVLEMLRGTDHWPEKNWFDGAILFLETAEPEFLPMYFARAIRSYGVMGILHQISAIILGRPGGNLPIEKFQHYYDSLLKIVTNEFGLKELPIIANLDFGHTDPIATLPYGLDAELNCSDGILNILESGVI